MLFILSLILMHKIFDLFCPIIFFFFFRHKKTRYTRIDGYCNNLKTPNLGSHNIAYGRLLNGVYSDGESISFYFPILMSVPQFMNILWQV